MRGFIEANDGEIIECEWETGDPVHLPPIPGLASIPSVQDASSLRGGFERFQLADVHDLFSGERVTTPAQPRKRMVLPYVALFLTCFVAGGLGAVALDWMQHRRHA